MKKILSVLFVILGLIPVVAATSVMYLSTEKKYAFTVENLSQTIPEFIENADKQMAMANKWTELMDPETGQVSVADLFAVCQAGGLNTYRAEGFNQCRSFIVKLLENAELEAEEGFLGGFCPPAYDEQGKQLNGLKSINENTRIGDFCSSTNIAGGEVVFRKGYNCTCAAYACNPGYESKGGACNKIVADENGNCLRKEYSMSGNFSEPGAALKFCEGKAVKGCKVVNAIKNFPSPGKVVCNATQEELTGVKARNIACPMQAYPETAENNTTAKCQSFCLAKAQQNSCKYTNVIMQHSKKQCVCNPNERSYSASNIYKEVCGKDKGKTGKKEYCEESFFNWTQTQIGVAMSFAQDYAQIKHGNTVYCSNSHRKTGNDDYIKCATSDGSVFYEFKFNDVRESVDADRRLSERSALCRLVGGDANYIDNYKICKKIKADTCNKKLKTLAQKYGHSVQWKNDRCIFTADGDGNVMGTDDFESSLAKIEGLDNRAFFELQVIAVRDNFVLEDEIEKYVKTQIKDTRKVTCDPGYKTVKVADGILARIVGNSDDIKRCYVDGKPIDFVFNDLSEIMNYQRNAGESGAKCVGNAGKYDGHYCRGLTKNECFELEEKLLNELKRNGWSGDKDLVDWDEKAGACELNDAQFANNINKTGKYTAIVGLTVMGAFSGGSTSALAIGLMATELAGIAGEIYTVRKKELLPQQWADEFLNQSRKCKSASCAETTLRNNFGKIQQVQDMLNGDVLKQVDTELARLAELLPDEKFEQIMNSAEAPSCWETWECQEKIFMGMQMASLTVAIGKGLVNLSRVIARKAGAAAAKKTVAATTKKSLQEEFAEIGVKENAVYRDIKTGKFISADEVLRRIDEMPSSSTADDFARIGVREEKTATGAFRYRDIKTGKFISEDEVLRRIGEMPNAPKTWKEELANIGVKEGSSYRDINTGKFISEDEVLRRIDEMPSSSTADDVVNGTKNTGKATDGASGGGPGGGAPRTTGGGSSSTPPRTTGGGSSGGAGRPTTTGARSTGEIADDVVDMTKGESKLLSVPADFSAESKRFIDEINEIGKNREYAVSRGVGRNNIYSAMPGNEARYIDKLLKDNDDLVASHFAQRDGTGKTLGSNWIVIKKTKDMFYTELNGNGGWYRRVATKTIGNLNGKSITTINGKQVFLETLDNGSVIGEFGGRPVVVVNYNGHKIPFYVSTGSAGKLKVPTGKWEVFFGIGKGDWLNKKDVDSIIKHYNSPELKSIAQALDNILGDQRNMEDVFGTISRKMYNGEGNLAMYEGQKVSADFINKMLDFSPVERENVSGLERNIEHVKSYFKSK